MVKRFKINPFKSIQNLELELGRVNVFIGENGCGKSNVLEAFVMAGAALSDRVDPRELESRGLRWDGFSSLVSNLEGDHRGDWVNLEVDFGSRSAKISVTDDNSWQGAKPFFSHQRSELASAEPLNLEALLGSRWNEHVQQQLNLLLATELDLTDALANLDSRSIAYMSIQKELDETRRKVGSFLFDYFTIYMPSIETLRRPDLSLSHPFGCNGEGLLVYLEHLQRNHANWKPFQESLAQHLEVFDWFESIQLSRSELGNLELKISDRYLKKGKVINQSTANEGFLFVLFYLTLFLSKDSPRFFAIDNIETALNPKLCTKLVKTLADLAKANGKQVIFTTHSPSVLDGLNLNDDEQRLFLIQRNQDGHTTARRIFKPQLVEGAKPRKMSEYFLNGNLGGLPSNFDL